MLSGRQRDTHKGCIEAIKQEGWCQNRIAIPLRVTAARNCLIVSLCIHKTYQDGAERML